MEGRNVCQYIMLVVQIPHMIFGCMYDVMLKATIPTKLKYTHSRNHQ